MQAEHPICVPSTSAYLLTKMLELPDMETQLTRFSFPCPECFGSILPPGNPANVDLVSMRDPTLGRSFLP